MSVQLAHTVVSSPQLTGRPPLLILHGLFGMSRNWRSVAKVLARQHSPIVCADLRNHGDSPHLADMGLQDMADDVRCLVQDKLGGSVHLMGHSLGGKVAMATALQYPKLIRSLISVDVSPQLSHPKSDWFRNVIELMLSLDLRRPPSPSLPAVKKAYSDILASVVLDQSTRDFLLLNLAVNPDKPGTFRWRFNLPTLLTHVDYILDAELSDSQLTYNGPALFIGGSLSPYIDPKDASIPRLFPQSRIVYVQGAGHAVHAERPSELCAQVAAFLQTVSAGDSASSGPA